MASVLNTFIAPPSTSRSDRREELCSERSHLSSAAPPPSNEICDRAEPRHLQLLSSSLYLPLSLSFQSPRSSSSPYVCPQRRPVQVSLTSASRGEDEGAVAANRFRAGAHCCEYSVLPRPLSTTMPHCEGRYLLTCVPRSGEDGGQQEQPLSCEARRVVTVWTNTDRASSAAPGGSCWKYFSP